MALTAGIFNDPAKAFLIEKAFSIISCCPVKSNPCLNLPTDPIIPDNLIFELMLSELSYFYQVKSKIEFLLQND